MRYVIACVLLVQSLGVAALDTQRIVEEIQADRISLATIAALQMLEDLDEKVGYGLCRAAGRSNCNTGGSVGYGLCRAAGREGCASDGSIGYGLCRSAGRGGGCDTAGSTGYGICRSAGRGNCEVNSSIGYGLCRAAGRTDCYVE